MPSLYLSLLPPAVLGDRRELLPAVVFRKVRVEMGYELLAVDIDGTLLNSANEVPAAHREALHRAQRAGMRIALCTGRSLTETRPVLEAISLNMDFVVLVFGAMIMDVRSFRTLHRTPVEPGVAADLVSLLAEYDYPVLAVCDVTTDGTDYVLLPGQRNTRLCEVWRERSPCRTEIIERWPPAGRTPLRIGVIGGWDELLELRTAAEKRFWKDAFKVNVIHAPNYGLNVIEFFHPDVNKWNALKRLCDSYRIAPSEVVAVGDDVNDLEMIREAGLGIAMGNAVSGVKAVADWVTECHDADGLAVAVDRLLAGSIGSDCRSVCGGDG
jgi:5-amino-6-(5-phospho-D-ribitylamino)uracil phosphatase